MAQAKTVYEVTVEGEYHAATKDGNVLKPYEVTVRLGEDHKKEGFLSVFKNLIAPKVMKAKYPDYADGLYTHRLVKVIDLANPEGMPNDPTLMTLGQLTAFINHNELPVKVGLYRDEDELRQAVIDCLEDEHTFLEQQDRRKEIRSKDLELTNSLNELNPDLNLGLAINAQAAAAEAQTIKPENIPDTSKVKLPEKQKVGNSTDEFNESILTEKDDDLGI